MICKTGTQSSAEGCWQLSRAAEKPATLTWEHGLAPFAGGAVVWTAPVRPPAELASRPRGVSGPVVRFVDAGGNHGRERRLASSQSCRFFRAIMRPLLPVTVPTSVLLDVALVQSPPAFTTRSTVCSAWTRSRWDL
jgi:hypothetical protein